MNEKAMIQIMKRMEEKLKEFMTEQEYMEFSTKIAREAFAIMVDDMADSDFKDFCQENFEEITGAEQ